MDLGLKGKKVILTGGSRGIGRAALEIFAAEGCDVAFFSRNQAQVDETIASLKKHGGKVHGATFDMNDMSGYAAWLKDAAEKLGGCDIFVPGASSSGSQATGDWKKSVDFDLLGTVQGCEALYKPLQKSGSGSVIIMSSTAAFETFMVPQAFNAIKAALITYGKQLSQAWGPKGIRVNTISPGSTLTDMNSAKSGKTDEEFAKEIAATPLGQRFAALTDEATVAILGAGVPHTEAVSPARADDLWARRRQLFFKPASGFGSRGTYRGDKLTRRVFGEILAGDYIAQALVPPSERRLEVEGAPVDLKMDLRNYVYRGEVQLVTARLYQGQTTNFRTPGGGFAPVLAVPCQVSGGAGASPAS